ncbi:hypothetical protein [Prevotella ihumii]|uniref:hypothetical protein n=1 Tax=Prevotella ihumii TaxID=1917878 RepID=UPI0009817933|nr:hypothetical protein [Prevotella ihumii]
MQKNFDFTTTRGERSVLNILLVVFSFAMLFELMAVLYQEFGMMSAWISTAAINVIDSISLVSEALSVLCMAGLFAVLYRAMKRADAAFPTFWRRANFGGVVFGFVVVSLCRVISLCADIDENTPWFDWIETIGSCCAGVSFAAILGLLMKRCSKRISRLGYYAFAMLCAVLGWLALSFVATFMGWAEGLFFAFNVLTFVSFWGFFYLFYAVARGSKMPI